MIICSLFFLGSASVGCVVQLVVMKVRVAAGAHADAHTVYSCPGLSVAAGGVLRAHYPSHRGWPGLLSGALEPSSRHSSLSTQPPLGPPGECRVHNIPYYS